MSDQQPQHKIPTKSNSQIARMLEIRAHRLRGQIGPNVMTDYYLLMESAKRLRGLK